MKKYQFSKFAFLLLFMSVFFSFCSSSATISDDDVDVITDPTVTTYDITPILTYYDNIDAVTYAVNGNTVTFTSKGIPNHTSPYWDTSHSLYEAYNGSNPDWRQNPNSIGEQNLTFTITLNPKEATNKSATPMGPIGLARNGVVFFNQYAAGGADLTNEINSFDQWLGHPAGTLYHYHIEPTYLTTQFSKSAFVGLLADGFPVYGPEENGATITSADLDDYHGHTSATADFPNGIYHYHITADAPYLNGNGFFGTAGSITR